MPYIRMDRELKRDFARFCKKRGVSMNTAFCRIAQKLVRKDNDVDENGFDAATRAELDRRIADFKAGRNIVEHDIIDV